MPTLKKIDLFKTLKAEYAAPRKPVLVDLGPAVYLSISGRGEPGGPEFSAKVGGLYAIAYTVKMTRKFGQRQDYAIGKLEGQWWAEPEGRCFTDLPKHQWCWRLLIRTPEFVKPAELDSAAVTLRKRGKPPGFEAVRLEEITEGQCVQMLHVGPYEQEGETAAKMQAFAESRGLRFHGRHHEIYLSDPRRVPPDRLKTILRHPVIAAGG